MIGTVKSTFIDAVNRIHVYPAIAEMKNACRGSWVLVRAYHKPSNFDNLRRLHQRNQANVPACSRIPYQIPSDCIAEKAGFIVFKDSKVVLFYTNDLYQTPTKATLHQDSQEAIQCVNGLAKLSRWTGTESCHRTDFQVPAIIVSYNMFMNAVDRMDQIRSTNVTRRREKRLSMTILTMVLDLCIHNAFSIHNHINPESKMRFNEFKYSVANQLIQLYTENNTSKRKSLQQASVNASLEATIGSTESSHMLLENQQGKFVECILCSTMKIEPKKETKYACTQCKKGYHVNCFAAMHYPGAMKREKPVIERLIRTFDEAHHPRKRNRTSKFISTINSMRLPFLK